MGEGAKRTRVLKEDQETKLGGMGSETNEENCVAPGDERQAVVASVACASMSFLSHLS